MQNTEIAEIWKDIPDYEGLYSISNHGNIKSYDKIVNCKNGTRKVTGKLLTPAFHEGYRFTLLTNSTTKKRWAVHRLVMYTFVGKSDLQIDHINTIKSCNFLWNLRYCTPKENTNYYIQSANKQSRGTNIKKTGWLGYVYFNNKHTSLGIYNSEELAHEAYKKAILEIAQGTFDPIKTRASNKRHRPNKTKENCGVSFDKHTGLWVAYMNFRRKKMYFGYHKTKEIAVIKRKEGRDLFFLNLKDN